MSGFFSANHILKGSHLGIGNGVGNGQDGRYGVYVFVVVGDVDEEVLVVEVDVVVVFSVINVVVSVGVFL